MNGSLSHLDVVTILGLLAAVMMVRAGVVTRMLDQRHPPRHCASCGRSYTGRTCPTCFGHDAR
jgi:hypothetical protein